MNNDIENLKKKLIYRSQYRGTKEMDKLIGNFVQTEIKNLNIDQLYKLEKFLEIDDDTLYKLYNNQIVEIDLLNNEIIELFKKFDYKK
tara:strand:+ start:1258 stop:1521 length:264 start_codon:yes stop_codon:yes gene_type:complete